jgi:hypothetical protein
MGDEYTVGNEDGLTPTSIQVRDAVARELYAQLPLRNQAIEQEDIPGVAYAVTMMLERLHLIPEPAQHG